MTTEQLKVVAKSIPDLYEAVTRSIGFRPERSVIVAPFVDNRLSAPLARLDFVRTEKDVETLTRVAHVIQREGAERIFIFGVEDVAGDSYPTIVRLTDVFDIPMERYVVRDGWINSLDCNDPCCQDMPITSAIVGHEFDAVGITPKADREGLRDTIRPQQTEGAPVAGFPDLEACAEAWAALLRGDYDEGEIPVTAVGAMLVSSGIPMLRDFVVGRVLTQTIDPDAFGEDVREAFAPLTEIDLPARETSERLAKLCRACPDIPGSAGVLAVTANYEWCVTGNGALANVALEEALRLDPSHRLALLLDRLTRLGIRIPNVD